jgi:hypothetical protein
MVRSVVFGVLGVGVGVVVVGCSHAAVTSRATSPAVQPPERLGFYVGQWSCEGTEYDEHGAVSGRYHLGVKVAGVLDNWLSVAVFEGDKQLTAELKGYDPTRRMFRHIWTAPDGTSGSLTSKGWDGDRLVFDEEQPAATERTRMTFTKVDDGHYTHRAEVDAGAGFRLQFEKTCKRVG